MTRVTLVLAHIKSEPSLRPSKRFLTSSRKRKKCSPTHSSPEPRAPHISPPSPAPRCMHRFRAALSARPPRLFSARRGDEPRRETIVAAFTSAANPPSSLRTTSHHYHPAAPASSAPFFAELVASLKLAESPSVTSFRRTARRVRSKM